jgi:uncharacterized membrane protein
MPSRSCLKPRKIRWVGVGAVLLFLTARFEPVHGRRFSSMGWGMDSSTTRSAATFHSFSPTRTAATADAATETSSASETIIETSTETSTPPLSVPEGAIQVSASVELPFPKAVAYDAFADLSRQATFSPWLKSVEYLEGERNAVGALTRWKLSYLGLSFSWNAISTVQDRHNGIIEWKSVTGLPNQGRVVFSEHPDDNGDASSVMHMTMCFSLPRFAARLLGPSQLVTIVEQRILKNTIHNFRRIVAENDWKRIQQQADDESRQ